MNSAITRIYKGSLALIFTAGLVAAVPATAVSSTDFSGERVTIIVPFGTGGNTDRWARMWAPYLEKYLPGNPSVIVKNEPGGGSLKSANAFEANSPRDGTEVIAGSTSTILNYIFFKGDTVEYEMRNWHPLVVTPQGSVIYARTDTGVLGYGENIAHDVEVLRSTPLNSGLTKPIAAELRGVLAHALLGIEDNINYVFGMQAASRRQGMARGEFGINMETPSGYQNTKDLIDDDIARPVMTLGVLDETGTVQRDVAFPDLPTVVEAYEAVNGTYPEGELFQAYKLFVGLAVNASKGLYLPPETPADVVDAWSEAVLAIIADPEFQRIAAPALEGYEIQTGQAARASLMAAVDVDDERRKWIRTWVNQKFGLAQ